MSSYYVSVKKHVYMDNTCTCMTRLCTLTLIIYIQYSFLPSTSEAGLQYKWRISSRMISDMIYVYFSTGAHTRSDQT